MSLLGVTAGSRGPGLRALSGAWVGAAAHGSQLQAGGGSGRAGEGSSAPRGVGEVGGKSVPKVPLRPAVSPGISPPPLLRDPEPASLEPAGAPGDSFRVPGPGAHPGSPPWRALWALGAHRLAHLRLAKTRLPRCPFTPPVAPHARVPFPCACGTSRHELQLQLRGGAEGRLGRLQPGPANFAQRRRRGWGPLRVPREPRDHLGLRAWRSVSRAGSDGGTT